MGKVVQVVDGKGYKTNSDVPITIASQMEMAAVVLVVVLKDKL